MRNSVILKVAIRAVMTVCERVSAVHAAHDYRRANLHVALEHLVNAEKSLRDALAEEQ